MLAKACLSKRHPYPLTESTQTAINLKIQDPSKEAFQSLI